MLHRLVRLWRGLSAWITQRPVELTHHYPPVRPYQPSNLHSRQH